jgi:hypothetical protein
MIITLPSSQRRPLIESHWRANLPIPGLDFDYRWIGASPTNNTAFRHLTPPDNFRDDVRRHCGGACYNDGSFDLTVKDNFAFNYHAEESDADWMIRATDDLMINFDRLADYMHNLSSQYNPQKEIVIRSNCVDFYGVLYPQGGSGAIFSRAASQKLARGHRRMTSLWREAEDITLGNYINANAMPMFTTADPAFLGLGWRSTEELAERIAVQNETCPPPRIKDERCVRPFVTPLRDVVFYHGPWAEFNVAKMVFAMNRTVMWYTGNNWRVRLCRSQTVA